ALWHLHTNTSLTQHHQRFERGLDQLAVIARGASICDRQQERVPVAVMVAWH
ncbi:hypothetical protein XENOCAPTIV_000130, partial [Xenoophorus captivus]